MQETIVSWAANAIVFALILWAWTFTGWEPPTPENIRKLDSEIEAAR